MTKNCKNNIQVNNLGFKYLQSQQIFKDINFTINTGEILCLLGPNGSGKTTLLNCLVDLLKPNYGEIIINNKSSNKLSGREISQNLGYVPQIITATFDYTVLDYVVCGCAPHLKLFKRPGKEEYNKAWESLEQMKIEHLADKSYAQISGGEQQQVCIARVLTQKPNFILLDEPTSHLDFGNQVSVLKIIKELARQNFGIIMTSHNPDHALMMQGKTLMMKNCGNYKYGNTDEIVNEYTLRDLYGIDLYLEKSKNANRKTCIAPSI